MESAEIIYKVKTAHVSDLIEHLNACNNNFIPPLNTRINIENYAKKISDKATTFEAWNSQELIGVVAVYYNEAEQFGYITNVSIIKKYMGLGIAGELMKLSIKHSLQNRFNSIKLEVNEANESAIKLYKKYGFTEQEKENGFLKMILTK